MTTTEDTTPMTPPTVPPVTPELRAEARRRPGAMLYSIDRYFDPDGEVPGYGVVGCWQVDHQGTIARFIHNPNYRPSPVSLGWPAPQNEAEASLQRAASGYGSEQILLAALVDAHLLLYAEEAVKDLFTLAGEDDRAVLEACTSTDHLPPHWPGVTQLTGRQLANLVDRVDLRLNPRSVPSVTLPIEDLQQLIEPSAPTG